MKKNKTDEIVASVKSFEDDFGAGSYDAQTITKGEYEKMQQREKVYVHKDNGKKVW